MNDAARDASAISSEIRALSPRARDAVAGLGALCAWLAQNPGQSGDTVTRPHPLLLLVRRASFFVLIAPAAVWDKGRELLSPYLEKFAAVEARLVLLGRPTDPDLSQALNLGLCALLPAAPAPEEAFVALHGAFELMDVKAVAAKILGRKTDIMTRRSLHPILRARIEASAQQVF